MSNEQHIPYFDLTRQFANYRTDWLKEIERLGESGNFILGAAINDVESTFAKFLNVKHAITVASGTDAIVLALRAAGVGPGDVVIVPNFTFYASVEAISLTGAQPRFVDIRLEDFSIDPEKISGAIDEKVKAILPVHLYGLPADMVEICAIANQHGITVVEDVAQAFGSRCADRFTGTVGQMGCFSFYPTKVLGVFGDGGMVTTNDDGYAEKLKLLRNHGIIGPNQHELIGCTSRLDAVQAVLLSLKLKWVQQAMTRRRELANRYVEQLRNCDLILPKDQSDRSHVFNIFTVRLQQREKLIDAFKANHIGCQIYYPMPVHQQPAYRHLGFEDKDFPASLQACREVLSLPLYPEMPNSHVDRVCEVIRNTLA